MSVSHRVADGAASYIPNEANLSQKEARQVEDRIRVLHEIMVDESLVQYQRAFAEVACLRGLLERVDTVADRATRARALLRYVLFEDGIAFFAGKEPDNIVYIANLVRWYTDPDLGLAASLNDRDTALYWKVFEALRESLEWWEEDLVDQW